MGGIGVWRVGEGGGISPEFGGGAPVIQTNNNQQITSNEIANSNTSTSTAVSAIADSVGDWVLTLTLLPEGTITINFVATDFAGATSTPRKVVIRVKIPPPPVVLSDVPGITSPTDFSAPFSTTTLTFIGTLSPSFVISNDINSDTFVADGSGN